MLLKNLPLTYKQVSEKTSMDKILKEISQCKNLDGQIKKKILNSESEEYYKYVMSYQWIVIICF